MRGTLEWDLAHLDGHAAQAYPGGFDPARLEVCRVLASVKTATWCWARFEHPALQWHAEHHLAIVTGLMARRLFRAADKRAEVAPSALDGSLLVENLAVDVRPSSQVRLCAVAAGVEGDMGHTISQEMQSVAQQESQSAVCAKTTAAAAVRSGGPR